MSNRDYSHLQAAFIEESRELTGNLVRTLERLKSAPDSQDSLESLMRGIRALRAASLMFGFSQVSDLAARAEERPNAVYAGRYILNTKVLQLLTDGVRLTARCLNSELTENDFSARAMVIVDDLDHVLKQSDKTLQAEDEGARKGIDRRLFDALQRIILGMELLWKQMSGESGTPGDFIPDYDIRLSEACSTLLDLPHDLTPGQAAEFFRHLETELDLAAAQSEFGLEPRTALTAGYDRQNMFLEARILLGAGADRRVRRDFPRSGASSETGAGR